MQDKVMAHLIDRKGGSWGGDPRRGAAMGRPTRDGGFTATENAAPFHLRRIPLDSGGYDAGGAYWGIGMPLYGFIGPVADITGYVRGRTREDAKAEVRKLHPKARFFR